MNRKGFLSKVFQLGAVFFAGSLVRLNAEADEAKTDGSIVAKTANPAETPCQDKVNFAKSWVKRFMNVLDKNLDDKTRKKIMENCGKECYCAYYGTAIPPKQGIESVDQFLEQMQKFIGKENAYRDRGKVYFNYIGNSKGLKIADGYCLCPMVEDGPEGLSHTYCFCSTGYIKEMFERMLGESVKVELLESFRRGGKKCRFLIHV